MNAWFRDPRFREGEAKSIAADEADRRNQRDTAIHFHFQAAEAWASLAQSVPGDYPHTRSDIAISAAVSYASACHFDRAVKFAQLMLAQQGALSARGRGELTKIVEEYAGLAQLPIPRERMPARAAPPRRMRAVVRPRPAKPEAA